MVLHPQFQQSSYRLASLHSKNFSISTSPITQILPPYFFWWFSASSIPSNILLTCSLLQDLSSKPKAIFVRVVLILLSSSLSSLALYRSSMALLSPDSLFQGLTPKKKKINNLKAISNLQTPFLRFASYFFYENNPKAILNLQTAFFKACLLKKMKKSIQSNLKSPDSIFQGWPLKKKKQNIISKQSQISRLHFSRLASLKKMKNNSRAISNLQTPCFKPCLLKKNPRAISNLQTAFFKACLLLKIL